MVLWVASRLRVAMIAVRFGALLLATIPAGLLASTGVVQAQCAGASCVVTTNGDTLGGPNTSLRDAMTYANAHPGTTITFSNSIANQTITLTSQLPVLLGNNTTIDGGANNITLNGANTYRGFFVGDAGQTANGPTNATIENLTITQTKALGGAGASPGFSGGGGGAGMGGAIFVSSTGSLTVSNVALSSNQAVGGTGGSSVFFGGMGGGGGMGGNGSFGGGGFGPGSNGGNPGSETAPGSPGLLPGAGNGGTGTGSGGPGTGGSGGANGGGGGSGSLAGGGGGAGGGNATTDGGAGGFGGGGGASSTAGGNGGYGGGGGGGGSGAGGQGGFGGGGGGGSGTGAAGFGGGNGGGSAGAFSGGGGGGGAGLGGGIYVQAGGSVNVTGAITVDGTNTAAGGAGGTVSAFDGSCGCTRQGNAPGGAGLGSGIFYQGSVGSTSTMTFGAGTQSIGGTIADYIGSGGTNPNGGANAANQGGKLAIAKNGSGTLTLTSANTYSGGTSLNVGTLQIDDDHALGSGDLTMAAGTTLTFSGNRTIANNIGLTGDPTFDVEAGTTDTISGVLSDTSPGPNAGIVEKTGAGTLVLSGANTYSGGTTISAGTLQVTNSTPGTSSSVGTGAVTMAGGTFQAGANNLTFNNSFLLNTVGGTFDTNGNTLKLSGVIADGDGPGSLIKTGTGTLELSGINTYTGVTTINGGTLALSGSGSIAVSSGVANGGTFDISGTTSGASIKSLSGSGIVTLGSKTLTLSNAGDTFSGAIGGTGGLTLTAGSETLTGSNSYTGATTINGGTLTLSSTGSITSSVTNAATFANAGAVTGGVTNAATFNNNSGGTVSGLLTNAAGTTTNAGQLNGGASISGGSLITTGVIAGGLTNSATVNANGGSIDGAIVNNAGSFNVGGTVTSDETFGNASGATLAVNSGGTYTLQDMLTNSGVVTVANGGSLIATLGGITNNIGGHINVAAGGTLTDALNNAGAVDNSGAYNADINNLAGGVVVNHSGGTWTGNLLSNVATVTNQAGAIWVGNGANSAGGTLNNSGTWTGTISNAGTFVNSAGATVSGLVTNSGTAFNAGTLNGGLTNTGGTFTNIGVINGPMQVSGGVLTGMGSVGAVTIGNGGVFAPGDGTPGASTTIGSLALQSGAIYQVQLNPTTASFANVTGAATLNGASVSAVFAPGSYISKQYTILNAGSINGQFNSITLDTNLPSNLHTSLSYDTTHAYLDLLLNFSIPTGLKGNQRGVADALSNFFDTTGGIPMAYSTLSSAALSQVAGETATGSQQTTFDAMTQFLGVISDPFINGRDDVRNPTSGVTAFAEDGEQASSHAGDKRAAYAMFTKAPPSAAFFEPRWSVWSASFGGYQATDGNLAAGSNSAISRIYGSAVGADYRISPSTLAGFALAGGGTSFSVANGGSGRSDLFQAGAFIRHTIGQAYISGALAYGWQDVTTNRTLSVAGIDQLQARFNANAYSGRAESGYRFVTPWMGGVGITPYAAGQFTVFDLPAYAESVVSGANTFALAYGAKSVTDTRSEVGIRTDKSYAISDAILTLRGRFAWAHDFNPDRSIGATFQALPGASFVVNGAGQVPDSAMMTASAELKWTNGWSTAATFEGEFSRVVQSYAGKGVVRYAW